MKIPPFSGPVKAPARLSFVTLAATLAAAFFAALVAVATFDLHPHLEPTRFEVAALVTQLALLYVLPFLVVGWVGAGLSRWLGRPQWIGGLVLLFFLGPIGWAVVQGVSARARSADGSPTDRPAELRPAGFRPGPQTGSTVEPADPDPPPVILLVVDGLDPALLRDLVRAGDLPNFERLLAEGTWGPLTSLEPTLSPLLWTSLATGRLPRDHGIHHFVRHQVPGLSAPLDHFPPRTGLTHHLVPWLESLGWTGWRAVPYTSPARRRRALWEIVGEYWPVGIYRWLVTWPAEPVEGFLVAGGLWASPHRGFETGQEANEADNEGEDRSRAEGMGWHPESQGWLDEMERRSDRPLERGWTWPPELIDELAPLREPVRRRELKPYLTPRTPVDLRQPDQRFIARSLRDPTLRDLMRLTRRHHPKFLAAAFYSVDAFGHRFVGQQQEGGPYAPALAERYRYTDRMLGRFRAQLDAIYGRPLHLLVVSDHGWDFVAGHHFAAPDGVVIAHGPAFDPERRIPGASLLDIAPLVLRLLGLPVADDMPGSDTHRFLLGASAAPEQQRIATWERGDRVGDDTIEALDERQRRELRSLGYLP